MLTMNILHSMPFLNDQRLLKLVAWGRLLVKLALCTETILFLTKNMWRFNPVWRTKRWQCV